MNKPCLKQLVVLTLCTVIAHTAARADDAVARADIVFKGSSTLHDFEGTAATNPFTAIIAEDQKTGKLRVSGKTSLNVQEMTTDNRKRDANMYKMFELEHFNTIEGFLSETLICEEEESIGMLHLKIHGTEQDVKATLSGVQREGDQISCIMTFPISLTAFGLKPPSVMGLIKVDDTVQVECHVTGKIADSHTEG